MTKSRAKAKMTKVSFNIREEDHSRLEEVAFSNGETMTAAFRKAVRFYVLCLDEAQKGNAIIFRDPEGEERQQIIL